MPDQRPPLPRARRNRALFWLLALAVSMATAAAAAFLRVSFLSLSLLVSLVLYGTLAWFFGHYERSLWRVAAPLLFLGRAVFGRGWGAGGQGGVPGRPLDSARAPPFLWSPSPPLLLPRALAR